MGKDLDDLNLTDQQKTRLLSFALDARNQEPSRSGDEERGDLLCDILRCPLPAPGSGADLSLAATGAAHSTLRLVQGPPIRDLLGAPETDVSVLRRIKDYAKALGARAESEVEKDVFLAIYFAAIAAARVCQGERITEHTHKDLLRFFGDFVNARWMTTDLTQLFRRVIEDYDATKHLNHGPAE